MAWSVARTTSHTGAAAPLTFPTVLVNQGGAWSTTSQTATIPRSGTYFLHIGTGASAGKYVNFNLQRDGITQFDIIMRSTTLNGVDTLSRTGILNLSTGWVLRIMQNGGDEYQSFSDAGMQAVFIGFLL